MSKEIIEYSSDISLDQRENIKIIINKFIMFLNENDIENNYFKDVIKNDIITQIIIYVLYKLITLNFTILNINEVSSILPKEIKGGSIEDMITFLIILFILSNTFTSVDSIFSNKPTRFVKLQSRPISRTRIFNTYTPGHTNSSRTSPSKTSPSKTSIISTQDELPLKTITISKFMFQFNNTINKFVYKLNNETKNIKEQKRR